MTRATTGEEGGVIDEFKKGGVNECQHITCNSELTKRATTGSVLCHATRKLRVGIEWSVFGLPRYLR